MKTFNKNIIVTALTILIIAVSIMVNYSSSKDVAKEIEGSDFTIIKSIESPNMWPVYLAAKNTCNTNSSQNQCGIECGFGDLYPCYFFNYDQLTQKPHIIATYYSKEDALYQTMMGFKNRNIIQFVTRKDFAATSSDSHSIFYTKELDLQTGKITTVKESETHEPYESYP